MSDQQQRSIPEIQADIAAARNSLASTVEEIVARAQPQAIIEHQKRNLQDYARSTIVDAEGDLRMDRVAMALGAVAGVFLLVGVIRRATA